MNSSVIDTISRFAPWALGQLRQYLPLLAVPPLLCAGLAVAWIVLSPASWKAYQSLLVRDDLLGESFKPGRFSSLENQKNAQETLLHIARKPEVIRATLETLGPEQTGSSSKAWPSEEEIDDLKDAISIIAPNGAEFGKTDVVVLSVKARSRERAKRFADLLASQIELNLRFVRQNQLRSMQTELELSVRQLQREYDLLAQKVKQVELTVGSDLPVLRSLLDRSSSAGDVQRSLEQLRQERRAAENELEVARKQLQLLKAIETDPDQFSVSSSELMTMQPIFKKLREGLTDAELKLMTESGRYEAGHPAVIHAKEVIAQTEEQIRREARTVIQGLQLQTTTAEEKLQRLRSFEQQYEQRLTRLAEQRVEYEVLAREMEKGGETLGKAKTELAQVQSLAESADQISLITRVGEPQTNLRPEGLSKKSMVLLATLGGLLLGGGLVGLFYRPDPHAPWLGPASGGQPVAVAHSANPLEPGKPEAATPESNGSVLSKPAGATPSLEPVSWPSLYGTAVVVTPTAGRWSYPPRGNEEGPTEPGQLESPIAAAEGSSSPLRQPADHHLWSEPPVERIPWADARLEAGHTPQPPDSPPADARQRSTASRPDLTPLIQISQGSAHRGRDFRPIVALPVAIPSRIDLSALRKDLADAAKQAAQTEQPSGLEPPPPAEPAAQPESTKPDEQPAPADAARPNSALPLKDQLELLSRSITTFCDAIRVEPPTEGNP